MGSPKKQGLLALRNIGKAMVADFHLLGITTVSDLATHEADTLYLQLCSVTKRRHDPCVHDTFAAAIHQAQTGEARDWWDYTAERKKRQAAGTFPLVPRDVG